MSIKSIVQFLSKFPAKNKIENSQNQNNKYSYKYDEMKSTETNVSGVSWGEI